MARYGWEYRGRRGGYAGGYGRGYDARDYGEGRRAAYDRDVDEGWGMTGLYYHMTRGRRGGRGYDRGYDSPFGRIAVGQPHRGGGERGRRFTGMESNRVRGVYGSDFRRGYGGDYTRYTGGREGERGVRRRRQSPGWWG